MRSGETVLAPYADLVRPALTERFDFEGELGIVIGAGGRYIPADKAMDAIAGFTVLNDASARDWQRAASQWTAGKNFDGTMPIGPEIVTPDEVNILDVALTTALNGQVMQSARTSRMIVDIPSAVEFFSSFTTLRPGDVIATGTPGGVSYARTPPVWLEPGGVSYARTPPVWLEPGGVSYARTPPVWLEPGGVSYARTPPVWLEPGGVSYARTPPVWLEPGGVSYARTPPVWLEPGGVSYARTPPVWLEPGGVIEVTIEGVGTIENRVIAEEGDRSIWRWHPGRPASGL